MLQVGIAVDSAGHHIPDEGVSAILSGKLVVIVENHAANRGRTVAVFAYLRPKTQAITRLSETRIVPAVLQDISGGAMTIRRPQITQRIKHQAERIYLSKTVLLHLSAQDAT